MYVLVIDDDHMICKMAKFLLTEEGYEVDVASTGEAAVAMIERRQPDLFVLDLVLPDVDGFQVYQYLQGAGAETGILFLTPQGWLDDAADGLQLRLGAFLSKPFSAEQFLAAVNALASRCGGGPARRKLPERMRVGSAELRATTDRLIIRNGNLFRLMSLSSRETSLLHRLMLDPGNVVPDDVLQDSIGIVPGVGRDESVEAVLAALAARMAVGNADAPFVERCRDGYRFNIVASPDEEPAESEVAVALVEPSADQSERAASRTCEATTRSSAGGTVLRSISSDSRSMRATTGGSSRRKRAAISPAPGCSPVGETATSLEASVSPGSEPPPTVERPGTTPAFRPF